MDLQLGLAVSRNSAKGFDLNCSEFDFKEQGNNIKKRCFDEAFEETKNGDGGGDGDGDGGGDDDDHRMRRTLPLLSWNDQPNQHEDDNSLDTSSIVTNKNERDGDGLVGWPPINPWRKRICHQSRRGSIDINCVTVENARHSGGGGGGGGGGAGAANRRTNSLYVKVKMEGVGIARKVDLNLHHSHESLLRTLIAMFGKCHESAHSYLLTFQDKEGDWQLADHLPWRVFIGSVQRLKLQRKSQ